MASNKESGAETRRRRGSKLQRVLDALRTLDEGQASAGADLEKVGAELEKTGAELEKAGTERAEIRRLQEEMLKSLRNQANAFEDLTDELQDKYRRDDEADRLRKQWEEQELALVRAVNVCTAQMNLISSALGGDAAPGKGRSEQQTAWLQQLQLLQQERDSVLALAGLQEIGAPDEVYDFRVHEVIQRMPLPGPAAGDPRAPQWWNGRVSAVYERGLVYKGRVMKKAKVAVYAGGAQNV